MAVVDSRSPPPAVMDEEGRARILAEVIRQVAVVPGEAKAGTIFLAVMAAIGLREEECSLEIYAAIFLLIRRGVLIIDNCETPPDAPSIGGETTFKVSRDVTQFIWSDHYYEPGPDDQDDCGDDPP